MRDVELYNPCRILVVDDCRDTTTSLSMLLRCWGYEAFTANDGPAALKVAAACQPEVILLDIAMPGMDGFEVARRLRSEVRLTEALLVSCSGFCQEQDWQEALRSGCDYFLVKPANPDVLHQLLDSWLPRRRRFRAARLGDLYECSST